MSRFSKKVSEIRQRAIEHIKNALKKYEGVNISLVEMDYCPKPTIIEGKEDDFDNTTWLLDAIILEQEGLVFTGGTLEEEDEWDEDTIPTDALLNIEEEIENIVIAYEDYKSDEAMDGANRYVMGYSQASGMDLVVYADCLEDAEAKWEDGFFVEEEHDIWDCSDKDGWDNNKAEEIFQRVKKAMGAEKLLEEIWYNSDEGEMIGKLRKICEDNDVDLSNDGESEEDIENV